MFLQSKLLKEAANADFKSDTARFIPITYLYVQFEKNRK